MHFFLPHTAVEQGSSKFCSDIIKKCGEKNPTRMEDGLSTLHLAALEGRLEIFKFIAKNLDDQNPGSHGGSTPLHLAARAGHLSICSFIIERLKGKNLPPNPGNNTGWTPLLSAAKNGYLRICKVIIGKSNPKLKNFTTRWRLLKRQLILCFL